jgi:aminotransferase
MPACINLSVGEPDFRVPLHALKSGWKAVREGKTHYSQTNGIAELREALAQKAYRDYGLSYDPNGEILVTVGGTQAIFIALMSLLECLQQATLKMDRQRLCSRRALGKCRFCQVL